MISIFHLGFDKPNLIESQWYKNRNHPYLNAIREIIKQITNGNELESLQFLISNGEDPMLGLQVRLEREEVTSNIDINEFKNNLETQTIYIYRHENS